MTEPNRRLVHWIFNEAKFIQFLGIEPLDFGYGWCETRVRSTSSLEQQHGLIHAGVIMTLADHTCGGAAGSTVVPDKDVITVENKVTFVRPATGLVLFCRGEVLRSGKNLIFTEAEVTAEREGKRVLAAKASSTLSVIPLNRPI